MATIHISEADAARDSAGLLAQVRAGAEVVIESNHRPIAAFRAPIPRSHTIKEAIALLPEHFSGGMMDEDFARDVVEGIDLHREPKDRSA